MSVAFPIDPAFAVKAHVIDAFRRAEPDPDPFEHWVLTEVLPAGFTGALRDLPLPAPDLHGVSGKREFHNDQRHYFSGSINDRFPLCRAIAEAFQSPEVAAAIQEETDSEIEGSYVRVEYAQDTNGFWLQPHTDLGVKKLTMLIYLPESPAQADLGTDIYRDPGVWAKRPPFSDNAALVFVPSAHTWHGLEPRPIEGIRRSLIVNYVSDEWRAREQLAYPETPVRV